MTEPTLHDPTPTASPSAQALPVPAIPQYLQQVYWWAYVHPHAVQVFERDWLVNTILFGNYGRLRDAALTELESEPGAAPQGNLLQIACAYGNLTPRLVQRMSSTAQLEVVDILPIQLANLQKKFPPDPRVTLIQSDSAALPQASASQDHVLLFFLLHEQPENVRKATLAQALRVVKPGGKVVLVDYHQPAKWHPLRPLMRLIFRWLEPYAMDLWHHEVASFLPRGHAVQSIRKTTYFGGLYQKVVLQM